MPWRHRGFFIMRLGTTTGKIRRLWFALTAGGTIGFGSSRKGAWRARYENPSESCGLCVVASGACSRDVLAERAKLSGDARADFTKRVFLGTVG